ncbi:MAG: thrombospondin type 3 repeat-containing protein [Planctomycetota bacterium]
MPPERRFRSLLATATFVSLAQIIGVRAEVPTTNVDRDAIHGVNPAAVEGWEKKPWVQQALNASDPGCMFCHSDIENVTVNMGFTINCTACHGGDPNARTKEEAHVQPTLPPIMDKTTPPLDYDLPYQKFINPSNLRVADESCGQCHPVKLEVVLKSMMATAAGHYAGGLYLGGVVDSKVPVYGTFAVEDTDGEVPTEEGAVQSLLDLVTYDPTGDPLDYATHYAAVPAQACARCHLWSRGKGYRGAVDADGTYRADGCAACHVLYANDGRSQSADMMIDHRQQGHAISHVVTKQIPTFQCVHCHHRGARIGLSFTGRAQMPPRLPSGPGVVGTTDEIFNSNFHYVDSETNPQDIHAELGMNCIDCHTSTAIMGDGNIYGHMDQATNIECETCHGRPDAEGTLIDNDGWPLWNVVRDPQGAVTMTSKVDGSLHDVRQVADIVDPTSPYYNPNASCAMNDNHIKEDGGLECYACHASWTPNCFGCHFERDERQMGQNLVTREWEVGKVSTNNKVYESLKHFSMGPNAEGRITPYIVGCQVIADVTAPDGSKILDFVMPTTTNALSGLGLQPVNPHTTRGPGEVRTCAECHRSPPSLGLGSGNYSLARDYAYATAIDGIRVIDRRTDAAMPTLVGTIPIPNPVAMTSTFDVIEGTVDHLYVAAGSLGVAVFDLMGDIPVAPVASIPDINALDVSRAGHFLFVVVEDVGVLIYDIQNPISPQQVAAVPIPTAQRAVPWGIHLFVAAGEAGLVVASIAHHDTPVVVGSLAGVNVVDLRLYAHMQKGSAFAARAYLADPDIGVHVVDLLPDFDEPTLVTTLPLAGASGLDTYTRYVVADTTTPSREHDYLYVAAGTNGLHIYDVTDPDGIYEAASLSDLGGNATHVDVSSHMNPPGVDDYALVANNVLGVQYVNVTDPQNPALVTSLSAPGGERVFFEVQQLDRFIDEMGNELKENSHPGVQTMSRKQIVQILGAPIDLCAVGGCCLPDGCVTMNEVDCQALDGVFLEDPAQCEFDDDGDGWPDDCDNCPGTENMEQTDQDSDGLGDACDECPIDVDNDADEDGHCADVDNCPETYNPGQGDADGNGVGDACEPVEAVPTVSTWGLIVLTLLLASSAKLYFGRRTVQMGNG